MLDKRSTQFNDISCMYVFKQITCEKDPNNNPL